MKKVILFLAIVLTSYFANASDTTTVSIQVSAGSKYAPINIVDQVSGNYVSATITNVAVQNNNADIATVAPNPTNTTIIKVTGVKAGTGTAVVSCHISYVDAGDGQTKSEDKTIVVSYTVIAAPHGVRLSLLFN
jgi:hypothetical protein